jgi:hypothetical protein
VIEKGTLEGFLAEDFI